MHIPSWTTILRAAQNNGPSLYARTSSADICLPPKLQAAVPACAFSCLQTFIINNYYDLTCSATADLGSLCVATTISGLTIGEGSLQCVVASCLGADIETQSGYTVCDGVAGAVPNMADTITATISQLTTFLSTSDDFSTSTSSTSAGSDATIIATTTTTASGSFTDSQLPFPTATSADSVSSSASSISSAITSSSTTNSGRVTSMLSSDISSLSTTGAQSSETTTSVSSSETTTSTSATSSGTAAAATAGAQEAGLGTSAKAGIATASVIVAAFIIGYLAYLFVVRRKEKQKRRSQRFSMFYPGDSRNNGAGSAFPGVTEGFQAAASQSPTRRYYAGETTQPQKESFWRRSFMPPQDIGVALAASTRVSPERRSNDNLAAPVNNSSFSPVLPISRVGLQPTRSPVRENPWNRAMSPEEDLEAQNQDVPILGSPRTRSSARSFSSAGVERPAPLRLSKMKLRGDSPPAGKMPLTPVYDNGNFEPTIKRVFDDSTMAPAAVRRQSRDIQSVNFSRKPASLSRTSRDHSGPFWSQNRRPSERFPVKPTVNVRKQSETSNYSTSVYTEFEEDETPDHDENKQLKTPMPASRMTGRPPLRDLQWPQLPRPANVAKQAVKPHSPRAAATIRQVDSSLDSRPSQPNFGPRTVGDTDDSSNTATFGPSMTGFHSPDSLSSSFPMPPTRTYRRPAPRRDGDLERQISNAYKAASIPTTATTPTKTYSQNVPTHPAYSTNVPPPIQRLSTGRPLAQKLQFQNYMPPPPLARSTSRARVIPMTSSSGDLYLRVGEMEG